MKKKRFNLATLALFAVLTACNNSNSNSTISDGAGETTISVNDNTTSVNIKHAGTIKLNDDETAIASISPNGYVNYKNNGREMIAKSSASGNISYTLRDNGGKLDPNDPAGKQFVSQIIREMHSYGFNLSERVDVLYKDGGTQAVLEEATNMKSDDLRKACYEYLMKKENISPAELPAIADKISAMKVDDPKKYLLVKYTPVFMKDQQGFTALLNAAGSIQSDNAKAAVLEAIANTGQKSEEQWIALIDATAKINATAEKTDVMVGIGQKAPHSEAVKAAYMKAAKTITAEAEYARVIGTIK